ncbi:DUF1345 domain-containing protein [Mucilaginibacter lappiensis]|uniref:Membrane protein n=1 Tax=Mucilaginibacter lappiensis TaxID=354630 RepID=A0A1N6Y8W9_9SPHI|nr:DUF1345 domain-containing protein [Mucilaginibacter lappiensis]MBB6109663.1 putative membrane protein [Mucilaginibacter lappiensis]MBB6128966.1 putative membrane protein [Mucilaginibacter lappiensis]SIR11010.1 Uncharacterized membrane protein [Mucilaginibacter lappiensis]
MPANKIKSKVWFRLDAHYRVLISLVISGIVLFLSLGHFSAPAEILIIWIAFALAIIIMDWIIILSSHPMEVRRIARIQDSSRTLIFLFVIIASLVSTLAIFFLLKSSKHLSPEAVTEHVLLSMASVIVSWVLVHTIFTLRYAHMYYTTDVDDDNNKKTLGGLDFPGDEKHPDYLDFVYFSFVIGMTFQVSDVEISSRQIRRLAWIHGMISFAFNTAIVALGINVISGLVSS